VLKIRLIPVLLLQDGLLVRSQNFSFHQIIGNPIHEVRRFNEWGVDEIVYLDISRGDAYDQRREDHKIHGLNDPFAILTEVSRTCFVPLTWGGRIRTLEDIQRRIAGGADKVTLNTAAFRTPELITAGAQLFGSQAIVVSIDARRDVSGTTEVFVEGGREATGMAPSEWARQAESRGAGEILIQSIDRDGMGQGYDLKLIEEVASAVQVPVIVLGGVGRYEHYVDAVRAGASAVAAANIWHFKELSDQGGKRALRKAGVDVRD